MTKAEIAEKIEKLEKARFENQMVDHWTDYNRQRDEELFQQIRELRKELEG